jgi:hypothetical protein
MNERRRSSFFHNFKSIILQTDFVLMSKQHKYLINFIREKQFGRGDLLITAAAPFQTSTHFYISTTTFQVTHHFFFTGSTAPLGPGLCFSVS